MFHMLDLHKLCSHRVIFINTTSFSVFLSFMVARPIFNQRLRHLVHYHIISALCLLVMFDVDGLAHSHTIVLAHNIVECQSYVRATIQCPAWWGCQIFHVGRSSDLQFYAYGFVY